MAKKSGGGPEYGEPVERTLKQITKLLEEAGRARTAGCSTRSAPSSRLLRCADARARPGVAGDHPRHELAINLYAEALGELVLYTASQPTQDVLGSLYMRLELGNPAAGQYFTPWAVASMMAQTTLGDLRSRSGREPSPEDPLTVLDPACGSGRMLLAAADSAPREMIDAGLIRFYGIDIDPLAAEMARLNLRLHLLPGQIICGDALAMNIGVRAGGSSVTPECTDMPGLLPQMPLWATGEKPAGTEEVGSVAAMRQAATPTSPPAPTVSPASLVMVAQAHRKKAREAAGADEQLGFAFEVEGLRRTA